MSKSRIQGSSSDGKPGKTGGTSKTARCPAAGSLKRALSKAVFIIFSEFRLQGDLPVPTGEDCHQLRQWWDCWTSSVHVKGKTVTKKKYESTVKGSKRIFDFACKPCDLKARQQSDSSWKRHVDVDVRMPSVSWCHDPIWLLKTRVRELVSDWGSGLAKTRKDPDPLVYSSFSDRLHGVYCPDQQGCLESKSANGGTLSVHPDECYPHDNVVRVGCAKTKGKFRTVTMQSARVKRVLKPVHAALYDHLSSFGWLVRGDVTRADFDCVIADVRKGEKIISGDYTAATDNIYLEAVIAIVEVLAECQELTEEERKVLVGSFSNLQWISQSGSLHPIKRGSMMGNLVSFPLLCLLNKACFDICCDIFYGSGSHRRGRFNGDDCLFPGSPEFFAVWKQVTGTYGLVVNDSKTGISSHWCDLNSQPARVGAKGLNPKPGLSFLRPFRQDSEDLLREVWSGIKSFRRDTQAWVFNVAMRHEISLREICVTDIPKRVIRFLFKKSWFRRALQLGPALVKEKGTKRTPEVVLGNPPRKEFYSMVTYENDASLRAHVDAWTGVSFCDFASEYKVRKNWVESPLDDGPLGPPRFLIHPITGIPIARRDHCPYSRSIDRKEYYKRTKEIPSVRPEWVIKHRTRWQFLWPATVFARFEANGWLLSDEECQSEWLEDHPLLSVKGEFYNAGPTRFHPALNGNFAPPSQSFPLSSGGLRLPVGYHEPTRLRTAKFSPRGLGHFNPGKLRRLRALFEQDRSGRFDKREESPLDLSDPHTSDILLCRETLSQRRLELGL